MIYSQNTEVCIIKPSFIEKIKILEVNQKKIVKTLEELKKRMETLESKVQKKIELDKTARKPINIYKLKKP